MGREKQIELKPCPFCGGEAEIHKRKTTCRFYAKSKKEIPKNGTMTKEIKYADGRISYEYVKAEYVARCIDTACIGRISRVYESKEVAKEAWNRRAEQ